MKKLLILLLMSLTLAGVVLAGYEDTWGSLLKKHTAVGIKNNVELILVNYQVKQYVKHYQNLRRWYMKKQCLDLYN